MTFQEEFTALYMTSSEIARRLGITRAAIVQARAKGMLPEAILVENHIMIWKREYIEPHVAAWEQRRNARIGV